MSRPNTAFISKVVFILMMGLLSACASDPSQKSDNASMYGPNDISFAEAPSPEDRDDMKRKARQAHETLRGLVSPDEGKAMGDYGPLVAKPAAQEDKLSNKNMKIRSNLSHFQGDY